MHYHNNEYAYLNIDQLRRTQNPRSINQKNSLAQFFNIKFDSNHPFRSTKVDQKFKQKLRTADKTISMENSCLFRKFRDHEDRRLYYSSNPRTKKLNTQKMLESITQIIEKQSATKKTNRDLQYRKKTVKLTHSENDSLPLKTNLRKSSNYDFQEKCSSPQQGRKPLFQKMLKKCEKLKQIYRYQNQLISIKHFQEERKVGIRFHTEPLSLFQMDPEKIEILQSTKKPGGFRKIFKVRFNSEESQILESRPNRKSLDIRKYKNESVLKQRLKYIIKKNMMKNDQLNEKIRRNQKWQQKHQSGNLKVLQKDQRLNVGPWDESDQAFELEFK